MMEESERTVECVVNEDIEIKKIKNFEEELQDFPHIIKYIQNLQEQLKLQQDDICELKNKLSVYEEKTKISEKNFTDAETQYDLEFQEKLLLQEWNIDNDDNHLSIADQVTEAAESAMLQTGFVYEETTGLYYHYTSGYYYDSKSGLYYNGNTGTYYYYDKESKSYKFHSQIHKELDEADNQLTNVQDKRTKKRKEKDKKRKVKPMQGNQTNTAVCEQDECSDNEDKESSDSKEDIIKLSSGSNSETDNEDLANAYPPCMRIVVKETNLSNLKVGTLFIVTYTGGSLGREGDHSVLIKDINISKHHAKIQYNKDNKLYEIIDLGSRNGTSLNGKRLSAAKQESEATKIVHGSILQVGSTKLLCHIHKGLETCGHCEPGLLISDTVIEDKTKSIKSQHQSELKRLKSKFGIEEDNSDSASRVADGYQDRAQLRRENFGSSSDHIKTQQSSLNESISKDNMGFKMLMKMGWSEGNSLGKRGDGVTEPVTLVPVVNKAGLGSDNLIPAAERDPNIEKKQTIWRKAQRRFKDIEK